MNDCAVETESPVKTFGAFTAVDDVTLRVAKGEIFGFLGPDGAGKTTTLRLMCGLMDPTEGSVLVAGYDVVHGAQAVKDRIGIRNKMC